MARELWRSIPDKFEIKGERYQKFRLVFGQGLTEYAIAAANLPKFIGGIYSNRDHIGDPNGRSPFEIVPAEIQRQALQIITDTYFSPTAFQFSPDLLNKLASESELDFMGTPFRRMRIDYPIHGIVQVIQASALFRLYDPLILQRLQDNEIRFPKGKEIFTMAEMFSSIREAIWQELDSGSNINSFKRELQRMHLYVLNTILLKSPLMMPHDATTLARSDLINLQTKIDQKLKDDRLDIYTVTHLQETQSKILAILQAQFQRTD